MKRSSCKMKPSSFRSNAFWQGYLKAFDIFGALTEYKPIRKYTISDEEAILSDWIAIGNDIRHAMGVIGNGEQESTVLAE